MISLEMVDSSWLEAPLPIYHCGMSWNCWKVLHWIHNDAGFLWKTNVLWQDTCSIQRRWAVVENNFLKSLEALTIAELAEDIVVGQRKKKS